MKTITIYVLRFALVAAVLTSIFRYCLSYGIDNKSTMIIVLTATLYFICMFASGWYFGKKEANYLPIYDVGFRFHLTTYLVHIMISELWFIFGFNSDYEKICTIHSTAITWGIFLCVHFLLFLWTRKKAINSIDKTELFE